MSRVSRIGLVCLALAALISAPGCASSSWSWFKGKKGPPTELAGVKTVKQSVKELQDLAKKAPQASPERDRVSRELAQRIQHEDEPTVRLEIIHTLAAYPTPVALAVLSAGMKDTDPDVRIACCKSWGRIKGPAAAESLSQTLGTETNIDVRLAAARALGETKDKKAVTALAEAASDPDPAMQYRAIASLKQVSGRDYGYDVKAWQQYAQGGNVETKTPSLAERFWPWK